jgi:hypothetical protein
MYDLQALSLREACCDHGLLQLLKGLSFHYLRCVQPRQQFSFQPLQLGCLLLVLLNHSALLLSFQFELILLFAHAAPLEVGNSILRVFSLSMYLRFPLTDLIVKGRHVTGKSKLFIHHLLLYTLNLLVFDQIHRKSSLLNALSLAFLHLQVHGLLLP